MASDPALPPHSAQAGSVSSHIAMPDMDVDRPHRDLHVLFASTGCTDPKLIATLLPRLADMQDVSMRAILDTGFRSQDMINACSFCLTMPNTARSPATVIDIELEAADLCDWADLLLLAPMDAYTLANMLHGHTNNLLLEIIRSWNVSKKILMIPGMSTLMWENPMTKKQLSKIRRKWNWVSVLQPLLWTLQGDSKTVLSWEAVDEAVEAVNNQVDLMNIGKGLDVSPTTRRQPLVKTSSQTVKSPLPDELWTIIFDFVGDWELAQNLHIFTNLPPPAEWASHMSTAGPTTYMEALELTILRGNLTDFKNFIAEHSVPRWLSRLCITLIMRFALTDLLAHLEANHNDLFWATFGHTFLPDKASAAFGRTEILEFWRTSPSFLTKEYTSEAVDGASSAGFVTVLEWWESSGLPLKFTEKSMEQASAHGHIGVLEWWKTQSTSINDSNVTVDSPKVRLQPGKSIAFATQNGHTDVVRWWVHSGIPFPHEDTVAKLASTHGHVEILQLWHEIKGSKMIFDNQVLVGATKSGNIKVLEWWKQSGLKVEYKTCDVEEALEDGYEGERGMEVRRWWARNGLNLGVGTSEWMKTKYLNS